MKTILRFILIICAIFIARTGRAQLFGEQHIISSNAHVSSPHIVDLDGDGDPDVIGIRSITNLAVWYKNLGGGIFSPPLSISNTYYPNSLSSADINGDGDMDVLSASYFNQTTIYHENLANGNFGYDLLANSQDVIPYFVTSGDMDGDGDLDVILIDDNGLVRITIFENLGGGQLSYDQSMTVFANAPNELVVVDLDGDSDNDLLAYSNTGNKILWYKNLGNGAFSAAQIISSQTNSPVSVASSDLDNDGDIDVLSTSNGDNKIAWYENLGNGIFGAQQIISNQSNNLSTIAVADLNGDGDLDVLSSASIDDNVFWFENLGDGQFGSQQIIASQLNAAAFAQAADFDGDLDLDVFAVSPLDFMVVWYENLSAGCADPLACNYDADALIPNTSCCYGCGCTNSLASNYSESAFCDDGSCEYTITGTVFFDENENGIMDASEYGLPFQSLVIEEMGQTMLTNDEGSFTANIGQNSAVFELIHSVTFPYSTTSNLQSFDPATSLSNHLFFGVSNEVPFFDISVDLYPNGNRFLCNAQANHNICFRNMSNLPMDGIIEIEYDELFQGYQEVTPIDSVVGNKVYMSYENLLPGQMFAYDIKLITPTADHIGEFVTSYARAYGYVDGYQVAYGEHELTMEITCAYDPNDKQAFPLGYTEDHLLLQETEQEFLIRFQNTGNAPAQNIRIQDTLDVNFDFSSFSVIANSHSVMVTIDPENRLIDFYFENIQLPDSVNNEPESHGFVSYKITPLPDLPVGTVLQNTAYIYFDNNEPIITNTTWTTIHECGGEAAVVIDSTVTCNGLLASIQSLYPLVENYEWTMDGVIISTGSSFENTFSEVGSYEVNLEASNPLCTESNAVTIHVVDLSEIDPCAGDFNCNGYRDFDDFSTLLNNFGCITDCAFDINNDGVTSVQDVILFMAVYGKNCLY